MQYDFSVPPNGGQVIDVKGRFIKYRSGNSAIRVRLSSGGYVDLLPGQGVWGVDYTGLTVNDRSGFQNAGTILAGDFDFRDDRITGTVDVVDGGKARTLGDAAMIGFSYQSAVAAKFAGCQLWNPAGSGKNAYVEQVSCYSAGGVAIGIAVLPSTAALATLGVGIVSKRLGGTASIMQARNESLAAVTPGAFLLLDKSQKSYKFSEPIMLAPGYGLVLINQAAAEELGVTFEIFEEKL